MKFVSTRGESPKLSFLEAVAEGLAPDGGLFVPEKMPDISGLLESWEKLSYPELCFEFLRLFADDIPADDLRKIAARSYEKFDDPAIAPLKKLDDGLWLLELYHGPTLAFKDFALQLLGNLYEYMLEKSGRKINVLGATSGDTGSAAINGLLGKKNVNIFILYPEGRVSPLQERRLPDFNRRHVRRRAGDSQGDFRRQRIQGAVEFVGGKFDKLGESARAVRLLYIRVAAPARRPARQGGFRSPDGQFRQRARGLDCVEMRNALRGLQSRDKPERHSLQAL